MNINQLRAELRAWGRYWAAKESLQGYASVSVTERCCEVMRTGIWISSDKHLFSHHADSILPPEWVKVVDLHIHQLPELTKSQGSEYSADHLKAALNAYYIKGQRNMTKDQFRAVQEAELLILTCT